MKKITVFALFLFLILIFSFIVIVCNNYSKKATIKKNYFGVLSNGEKVDIYYMKNTKGIELKIMNYGGAIVSAIVPDKNGNFADIVLGHDSFQGYLKANPYFGAIVGRYANRIAKGKFTLNGKVYTLATNNGQNHLHGGIKGFDKRIWNATPLITPNGVALKLSYLSKNGEEGYPGNLNVVVTYTLNNNNELRINYSASTDQTTIVNLTNHTYWNLAENGDILNHRIMINADKFTPVDSTLIPTGEIKSVYGTPFDFRKFRPIGDQINADNIQLKYANGGYDLNWVLNKDEHGSLSLAARVTEPISGRVLEVWTTEPGLQFYSGNFLDGSITGKNGQIYKKHTAFALEAQHFPDSPNHPNFPSVVLKPGQEYKQTTIYKFKTIR
ncbi:galactose mutarotase [bacterium]|nr:galactose mutarotase [bacterium]